MPVVADSGNFTVGPSSGLVLWTVVALAVVVAVGVWILRSDRSSRAGGAFPTRWANVSLFVVRLLLLSGAAAAVVALTSSSDRGGRTHLGPLSRSGDSLAISVASTEPNAVCEKHHVRSGEHLLPGAECDLSRALAGAQAHRATVVGVALDIRAEPATAGELGTYARLRLLRVFGLLVGALALERMLTNVALRRPFAPRNIAWLRAIAVSVAFVGLLIPWQVGRLADGLVRRYGDLAPDQLVLSYNASDAGRWIALGAVVLILVLAEIWRYGIRLQREAEATV
jgi:hypothetical protein